ncbi:MAG: glycosyltransferase [Rikenellaceae bacterium]|nr:glycosyltransferase [Rikenellaceae bacterium]
MDRTPLVSLIIPAYNVAEYLPQCLDSALGQTYPNLQIVIVDDGSTDRTPSVIDRYAASDPRVMAIHQENAGVMLARKRAIEAATGEYLCFLDGDDYLPLDTVEILYRGIEQWQTDIICGDIVRVSDGYKLSKPEKWDGTIDGNTFMRYQLTNVMEGYLVAKLYRRGLFEGLQYPADISLPKTNS